MKLKRLVTLFGMAALAAIVTTACPTDAGGGGIRANRIRHH
jgi:predicted small secreted protein